MTKPIILPIKHIKKEAFNCRTFTFTYPLRAKPGQFIMLWLPGIDQKPFSVSRQDETTFDITVAKIGRATTALFEKTKGDRVGIAGPYGRGFHLKSRTSIILAGGGCGAAPLRFLGQEAVRQKCSVIFATGARSKRDVLFADVFKDTRVTTDNGSLGDRGFVTDKLSELLEDRADKVYVCGPELMMKKAVDLCLTRRTACEASLERYMKCGLGVCGQCALDPLGLCVCQDGPVFSGNQLKKITEFGRYRRSKAGAKISFPHSS